MEETENQESVSLQHQQEKNSKKSFKLFFIIPTILLPAIFVTAYLTFIKKPKTESTSQNSKKPISSTISSEELSKHSTKDNCWLAIKGKVYDVTSFINSHPGGETIIEGCGKDATTLFLNRPGGKGPHPPRAQSLLPQYEIGELE